jgi:hypothetical protein
MCSANVQLKNVRFVNSNNTFTAPLVQSFLSWKEKKEEENLLCCDFLIRQAFFLHKSTTQKITIKLKKK